MLPSLVAGATIQVVAGSLRPATPPLLPALRSSPWLATAPFGAVLCYGVLCYALLHCAAPAVLGRCTYGSFGAIAAKSAATWPEPEAV